ncbi:molecular chaperone [Limnohabitans sp.]|uniref:TorD/DmsD family molecular chaperone n=1 Tax=Limnohabitans sp. TaxID=1907725 RepID=UPI00391CACCD
MSLIKHSSSALDEEIARAEMYGLLASLFYAPPGDALLAPLQAAVTEAPEQGAFLEEPWRSLVGQARSMNADQIAREHAALFGGVGKPEVYLFGSHYLSGFLNEKPLVLLREDLAALGLGRDERMPETEDHVACLFEVMRYLIAGDDVAVCNLSRQAEFFSRHVQPWVSRLCQALSSHPGARFYARLGDLTAAFVEVEAQGFDLL